jgi:cytosine/adenosine deaminase-related metal-dependent hydrolase
MFITNARVVTNDPELGVIENGAVKIEKDEVIDVGPKDEMEKKYLRGENDLLDGKGGTILPGFVNAYVSIESAIFPDFGIEERFGLSSEELKAKIYDTFQSLFDDNMFFTIVEKIAHDALKHGVTCVAGSIERYLHKIEVEKTVNSVEDILPFRFAIGEGIQNPEDLQRLIKSGEHPNYIPLISITNFNDSSLRTLKELADKFGSFIVIVLSDEMAEEKNAFSKYGMSNLERLRHLSLLGEHTIIVNARHFTETDLDVMASSGTMAIYCTRQMMTHGSEFPDIDGMMGRGVNVTLGTGSIPDLSILMEAQVTFLIRKMFKEGADFDSVYQTKKMLLENSYRMATKLFDKPMGKIVPGYVADLALYDYTFPLGDSKRPFLRNLIFDFLRNAEVSFTIVGGKIAYDAEAIEDDDLDRRVEAVKRKVISKIL